MVKRRNPQARQSAELRSRLNLWHHWLKFKKFRMQKPFQWAQPILRAKPIPGKRIKADLPLIPYFHRRDHEGVNLRVIR